MNLAVSKTMKNQAKPFLKWAGGKGQLLPQLEQYFPRELHSKYLQTYVEPFLGGGAVFFAIGQRFQFKNIYLSDINKDLVLAYQVIQQKPKELIQLLAQYQQLYDQTPYENRADLFIQKRQFFNEINVDVDYKCLNASSIERVAHLIFLNKTCFNGLFRLNSKGAFNVPFGKYKTAAICDEANIWAVSRALQTAQISHADYSEAAAYIDEQTFVYLDPPYRPISSTASFTTYAGAEFTDTHQLKLAAFFKKMDTERHAKLMLSNSDPANENSNDLFFENAYAGYNIARVSASRAINSDASKRGKITELLITNYTHEHMTAQNL